MTNYRPKAPQGIKSDQEIEWNERFRDHRGPLRRLSDFLSKTETGIFLYGVSAVFIIASPASLLIVIPLMFLHNQRLMNIHRHLPLRLPASCTGSDYGDVDIKGKPAKARGTVYIGNCRDTGEEVWLDDSSFRTHTAVFGTTGSGKTELLVGFAVNALTWSSGFVYCDGKADSALWAKICYIARRFGRDDDVLLLSYLIGRTKGNSNTLNFMAGGSADMLVNLFVGLMGASSGDGDMWKKRAISLVTAMITACVYFRDKGFMPLNVNVLRQFMSLEAIIDVAHEKPITLGVPGTPSYVSFANYKLPPSVIEGLNAFLKDLAGYSGETAREGKPQNDQCNQQFAFCSMQFTQVFGSFADTYKFIFATPLGDIEMDDVILNRRMLLVMLPSLEKSNDETASLGKIIVAAIKGMMGNSLISSKGLEGSYADVIDNKATSAYSAFTIILDELGYYFVNGIASIFAQARSLVFALIMGTQEKDSLELQGGTTGKEANAVLGNTNTKMFGKIEDPNSTYDLASKTAGEAHVAETAGYSVAQNSLSGSYSDRQDASITKTARIAWRDLKDQLSGQFHLSFMDRLVRVNVFYANPRELRAFTRRRFIMVRPPANIEDDYRSTLINATVLRFMGGAPQDEPLATVHAGTDAVHELNRAIKLIYRKDRSHGIAERTIATIIPSISRKADTIFADYYNGGDAAATDHGAGDDVDTGLLALTDKHEPLMERVEIPDTETPSNGLSDFLKGFNDSLGISDETLAVLSNESDTAGIDGDEALDAISPIEQAMRTQPPAHAPKEEYEEGANRDPEEVEIPMDWDDIPDDLGDESADDAEEDAVGGDEDGVPEYPVEIPDNLGDRSNPNGNAIDTQLHDTLLDIELSITGDEETAHVEAKNAIDLIDNAVEAVAHHPPEPIPDKMPRGTFEAALKDLISRVNTSSKKLS